MTTARMQQAALLALTLGGCFASHAPEDRADLREPGSDTASTAATAGAPAPRPGEPGDSGAGGSPPGPEASSRDAAGDAAPGTGAGAGASAPARDPANAAPDDGAGAGAPTETPGTEVWLGETHGQLVDCETEPLLAPLGERHRMRLLLVLERDASGAIEAASVTLGDGPGPGPARDPDAFHPEDPSRLRWNLCPRSSPVAGHEYPAHDVHLDDSRLTLTVYPGDFYGGWCALQQSYPASDTARRHFGSDHLCRPSDWIETLEDVNAVHPDDTAMTPEALCLGDFNRACECNADHCWARRVTPITLDLLRLDDAMEGRVVTDVAGDTAARLMRVSP